MGRPSAIEKHELGPLVVALEKRGVTSNRGIAQAIKDETGIKVSHEAVRVWRKGEVGTVALAARRAKPAPTNGHAKRQPPKVEPVELQNGEDPMDRIIRGLIALGECDQATPSERRAAYEQAGYFEFLRTHGEPPP